MKNMLFLNEKLISRYIRNSYNQMKQKLIKFCISSQSRGIGKCYRIIIQEALCYNTIHLHIVGVLHLFCCVLTSHMECHIAHNLECFICKFVIIIIPNL